MATSNALIKMVEESGLPPTKSQQLLQQFTEYFRIAAEWEHKSKEIVVTDASQIDLIAKARAAWLTLRDYRIAMEKTRVELKRDILTEGKTIDAIANLLKSLIGPPEKHLERQAKFVEFRQKAIEEERRKEADRLLREKEEADAKLEAEEAEKQRVENERLRIESHEKDRLHQEELNKREAEAEKQREKLKVEADKKLQKQRDKAAADKKKADDKLKKFEDKARAVNQKIIEAARVTREKEEKELAKEREKMRLEQKKKDDAAKKEQKRLEDEADRAEDARRAAMSSHDKLVAFVRELAGEDFYCGSCENYYSDADDRASDLLEEIGEKE